MAAFKFSTVQVEYFSCLCTVRVSQTSNAMQPTAIRTVANSLPENKVILLTLLISKRYITYIDLRKKADSIPISRVKSHKKRGACVGRGPRWCFAETISLASNRIFKNVCARREQKPSLLGLCRAAAKGAFISLIPQHFDLTLFISS